MVSLQDSERFFQLVVAISYQGHRWKYRHPFMWLNGQIVQSKINAYSIPNLSPSLSLCLTNATADGSGWLGVPSDWLLQMTFSHFSGEVILVSPYLHHLLWGCLPLADIKTTPAIGMGFLVRSYHLSANNLKQTKWKKKKKDLGRCTREQLKVWFVLISTKLSCRSVCDSFSTSFLPSARSQV